jgi:hypothetical protein
MEFVVIAITSSSILCWKPTERVFNISNATKEALKEDTLYREDNFCKITPSQGRWNVNQTISFVWDYPQTNQILPGTPKLFLREIKTYNELSMGSNCEVLVDGKLIGVLINKTQIEKNKYLFNPATTREPFRYFINDETNEIYRIIWSKERENVTTQPPYRIKK